jgi:trigger factor
MAFEQMKSQAERDVRGAMLLDKIAQAEKVDVADSEVEEELEKIAAHYRTTPDEIRKSLEKQGGTGTIQNNLRTRKSIEALVGKAKITEGEWVDEAANAVSEAKEEKPKKTAKSKSSEPKEAKKKTAKSKA